MVIVEENHEYSDIIGNSQAPYINSLANSYGLATNWTAVSHPSLPNYMAMSSASTQGITDDTGFTVNADNIANQLANAGYSWKAYMEGMPSPCFSGDSGPYAKKHDPFMFYSDIINTPAQCNRVVPFTQFGTDLSAGALPDFVWITPNLDNDMHDGSIAQGDSWLSSHLGPVLTSSWFTGGATVIVTWDEGTSDQSVSGSSGGGGHIPMIVITAGKGHSTLAAAGNHDGMVRSIEEWFGLPRLNGAASAANGDLSPLR